MSVNRLSVSPPDVNPRKYLMTAPSVRDFDIVSIHSTPTSGDTRQPDSVRRCCAFSVRFARLMSDRSRSLASTFARSVPAHMDRQDRLVHLLSRLDPSRQAQECGFRLQEIYKRKVMIMGSECNQIQLYYIEHKQSHIP